MTTEASNIPAQLLADLPDLPPALTGLLQHLRQKETGLDEGVALLQQDAELCRHIVLWAQSSLFALPTDKDDLHHIGRQLGLTTLRDLALIIALRDYLLPKTALNEDPPANLQRAVTARLLAAHACLDPDIAFCAALLHDLGIGLHKALGNAAKDLAALELGAAAAAHWQLPPPYVLVAGHTHPAGEFDPLLDLLNIADTWIHQDDSQQANLNAVLSRLFLDPGLLKALDEERQLKTQQSLALLSLSH